jgi:hypothetical protein
VRGIAAAQRRAYQCRDGFGAWDRVLGLPLILALAAATPVAVVWALAPLVVQARDRRFEADEWDDPATDRSAIARELGIPEVEPSDTPLAPRLERLRQPLQVLHEGANRLQRAYHLRVAGCVLSLALALAALGLGLTFGHDYPSLKRYAAAVDVFALALALHQWWAARVANQDWILARTRTELLRQWTFLRTFLHPAGSDAGPAEAAFAAKADEIGAHFAGSEPVGLWAWTWSALRPGHEHPARTLEARVQRYWDGTRAECAAMPPGAALAARDIHLYLRRRPVRQLAWFRISRRRLQTSGKLREHWMARLFLIAFGLALAKAVLVVAQPPAGGAAHAAASGGPGILPVATATSLLALLLLGVTTLSTALTSIYLSRNDRSLLHRYIAQERRIEDWLQDSLKTADGDAAAGPAPPGLAERFRTAMLGFEDLMIDELVDWIHISAHDALELGP